MRYAISEEARDGEIGFDPAALVQPLRVDDLAGRHVDVVRADTIQHASRVGAFEPEFGEGGLIEQPDGVPDAAMFVRAGLEPVLPPITVLVDRAF
jgi:hypothetical protein